MGDGRKQEEKRGGRPLFVYTYLEALAPRHTFADYGHDNELPIRKSKTLAYQAYLGYGSDNRRPAMGI